MPRQAPEGVGSPDIPGRWHLLVLIPLVLGAWVYHPVLRVNFFSDDFAHMASIESSGIVDFLLAPFGGHNLLVRNLVFLASWELFGLRAPLYYTTVLATHLLNVALLFAVVRSLVGGSALACFGAALWGTLPLCAGTLGWYSVYGQVLAATVLLGLLDRLSRFAGTSALPSAAEFGLWYGVLLAGTTCFGVGLGVALAFPVALFLLLPAAWSRSGVRIAWLLLPIVTVGLYFALRKFYALIGTLTLAEAIQERVALNGIAAVPAMLAHLLTYSVAGSVLGFFLPKPYPSTAAWLAMLGFLAGLGLVVARGGAATVRRAAALVALALGVYLVIAVGRAHVYAIFNIGASAAAKVARYHYAGTIPIVILLCLILREIGRLPGLCRVPVPLALGGGLLSIVAGKVLVGLPVQDYAWTKEYVQRTVDATTAGVRAWPAGSTAYVENEKTPLGVLGPALPNTLFPGRAGVFVLFHRSDQLEGRTVRFVERDQVVLQYYAMRPNSRLARLLVSPEQVPARP